MIVRRIVLLANRRGEAVQILRGLQSRPNRNASEIALMQVGLGDSDQALQWLETAWEDRIPPSILLRPAFDFLRGEPRFRDLSRIGIPGQRSARRQLAICLMFIPLDESIGASLKPILLPDLRPVDGLLRSLLRVRAMFLLLSLKAKSE